MEKLNDPLHSFPCTPAAVWPWLCSIELKPRCSIYGHVTLTDTPVILHCCGAANHQIKSGYPHFSGGRSGEGQLTDRGWVHWYRRFLLFGLQRNLIFWDPKKRNPIHFKWHFFDNINVYVTIPWLVICRSTIQTETLWIKLKIWIVGIYLSS